MTTELSHDAIGIRRPAPGRDPAAVLFLIDQLCAVGGAERALLRIVAHLPRDRFRPLVATFRYHPEFPARELAAPLHVFPLRHTWGAGAPAVAWRLGRLIRRERVRIVHTFFETSDLWGGAVARLSGCPVLISSRRDMGIQRSWKHGLAYKLLGRMFDQVQTVSEQVRQFTIRQDALAPARVVTVYNGVDLPPGAAYPREELCRRIGVPPASPLVVTVANIRPLKAINILIRAAALVCQTRPDAVFLIVGNAPDAAYLAALRDLAASLGIADRVRFWGPEREVAPVLRAADLFALLSYTEGFSNALVEAMACALPCVASDVGGNAEALRDGESGYLVPAGDAGAAAARIRQLLDSPAMRRSMGAAAAAAAHRSFTTAAMIERLTGCYQSLLDAAFVE